MPKPDKPIPDLKDTDLTLPASNSDEENIKQLAKYFHEITQPGHGQFFDFSNVPEYEKPVLQKLCRHYGWILEKPFFIRKQDHSLN